MPSIQYFYKEYRCSSNAPLSCDLPGATAREVKGAKFCLECGFPAILPHKAEIKGSRGIYQVTSYLGVRGLGRLYSGIQLTDSEPVLIKEYLLPNKSFNEEETRQRQETFKRVAGVSLADGRVQNFRLINPWEAIADQQRECCYAIMKRVETFQTLNDFLVKKKEPMPASQVREVLNQTLQTLEFIHTQKLRLPSNQTLSQLAHGNINLDSVLIQEEGHQQLYVYLCDLALWEELFIPPSIRSQPSNPKPQQDLEALAQVAFYLWVGQTRNVDPRNDEHWPNSNRHLKKFLHRLIGIDNPFESALQAREALLALPKEQQNSSSAPLVVDEEQERSFRKLFLIILGILTLVLMGGGGWFWWKYSSSNQQLESSLQSESNFASIAGVEPGEYTYIGERDSTWSHILRKGVDNNKLEDILKQPKKDTKFNYQSVASLDIRKEGNFIDKETKSKPIQEVKSGKKNFAITSLEDQVTDEFEKKQIAYDGLFIYVVGSKKGGNLAKPLNGKISLESLRKIYTGEITNWKQLSELDLPIEPYAPTELEAIRLFQKKVLKDDADLINKFNRTITRDRFQSTGDTLKLVYEKFDKEKGQTGIIGFGVISKFLGQCRGYPLAIVDDNNRATQALLQPNDQPINPEEYQRCSKGTAYYPNVQAFESKSYALGYPVFVVYLKDNRPPAVAASKFADMLTTFQGQCLLSKVELVPLKAMQKEYRSHVCQSMP
ncbi:serine/threonine protein kinase (plasmid) [Brasilonema octagenarum UFV-E1]|uniref:Serine/threonine protein kinase n=2 Tax=Brasilonema TaxID=383614 RepID=A0A856MMY1_9CYAN|nr:MULTISPECIES: substrate-binding domain-containing protein [Brasilonema]NMF62531.1 serine/threonine protein kinase [Brasilonema octagenarum UFV-OR1]QDL12783.1 serine/threonine protein kinase [Brasilonema sennae CENA114]QDL19179.1 serine/threonine protein kinase [Brasilonema octagenarum UFV-E1]